jgi:hypothetical protein
VAEEGITMTKSTVDQLRRMQDMLSVRGRHFKNGNWLTTNPNRNTCNRHQSTCKAGLWRSSS